MRIKKGDKVQVLSGNDKGKTGEVLGTSPKTDKIIVKDVNVRTKHTKPTKMNQQGGIIEMECPMPAAKVNLVCPKCSKVTRVGYLVKGEEKVRVCKKCNKEIN